jgi:hypothetical protein
VSRLLDVAVAMGCSVWVDVPVRVAASDGDAEAVNVCGSDRVWPKVADKAPENVVD